MRYCYRGMWSSQDIKTVKETLFYSSGGNRYNFLSVLYFCILCAVSFSEETDLTKLISSYQIWNFRHFLVRLLSRLKYLVRFRSFDKYIFIYLVFCSCFLVNLKRFFHPNSTLILKSSLSSPRWLFILNIKAFSRVRACVCKIWLFSVKPFSHL